MFNYYKLDRTERKNESLEGSDVFREWEREVRRLLNYSSRKFTLKK